MTPNYTYMLVYLKFLVLVNLNCKEQNGLNRHKLYIKVYRKKLKKNKKSKNQKKGKKDQSLLKKIMKNFKKLEMLVVKIFANLSWKIILLRQ